MKTNKEDYISITGNRIDYGFHSRYRVEEDGSYSWYIPTFEMFFSSENLEAGEKRAKIMAQSFFNFWIESQSFRSFVLQIHKLGFKANENHNLVIKNLLKRGVSDIKLKSKGGKIPKDFINAHSISSEMNLQMAS